MSRGTLTWFETISSYSVVTCSVMMYDVVRV